MGIDWGDFKNDGSLGLAIGNFANEMTALYVTDDPKRLQFSDLANIFGLGRPTQPPLKFGLFFFDYDLDGRLDLLSANGHLESDIAKIQASADLRPVGPALLEHRPARPRNCSSSSARTKPAPTCSARSSAAAAPTPTSTATATSTSSLTENGGPAHLFRNDGGNKNHWLRLGPTGDRLQPRRPSAPGSRRGRRTSQPSPALPGEGLPLLGRASADLRPRRGREGGQGHDPLALRREDRTESLAGGQTIKIVEPAALD